MSNVIVCIGDSLTAGQFVQPHQAWPRLLYGHDILTAGVPGDTTRLALERFPVEVQAVGPKAVVIQFGHNDCNRWASDRGLPRVAKYAYEANLYEMVERCRTFEAVPLLCTLTPSRRSTVHANDVLDYNRVIHDMVLSTSVEIIDVREAFEDNYDLLMNDGVHLTVDGHRLYAKTVQKTLDEHFLT